jgi:hypothetical protein
MLFTSIFTYTVALAAALPMVASLYTGPPYNPKYPWDKDLRVYKLGKIPSRSRKNPDRAADWLGRCNEGQAKRGEDVGLGMYGCGEFKGLGTVICKSSHFPSPFPFIHPLRSKTDVQLADIFLLSFRQVRQRQEDRRALAETPGGLPLGRSREWRPVCEEQAEGWRQVLPVRQ